MDAPPMVSTQGLHDPLLIAEKVCIFQHININSILHIFYIFKGAWGTKDPDDCPPLSSRWKLRRLGTGWAYRGNVQVNVPLFAFKNIFIKIAKNVNKKGNVMTKFSQTWGNAIGSDKMMQILQINS